jgi:hypothetical protein
LKIVDFQTTYNFFFLPTFYLRQRFFYSLHFSAYLDTLDSLMDPEHVQLCSLVSWEEDTLVGEKAVKLCNEDRRQFSGSVFEMVTIMFVSALHSNSYVEILAPNVKKFEIRPRGIISSWG